MKSLNKMLYGTDHTEKLARFSEEIETVKENYQGEFDTNKHMYTMQTHRSKGEVRIEVDKDVPQDLMEQILMVFNEVWK